MEIDLIETDDPPSSYRSAETEHYGSELGEDGEALLSQLLDSVEVAGTVDSQELNLQDEGLPISPRPKKGRSRGNAKRRNLHREAQELVHKGALEDIPAHLSDLDSNTFSVHDESPGRIRWDPSLPSEETTDKSPLERFRTSPRKPMSVTDLVSPAWCEIQYLYSLSRFGRVRRTPAMHRGSSVHKELEEQVHERVPVEVLTREDHWGLKIWNVIQGLRALRVTGLTRELEVWGVLDGQIVNGIIDELSTRCPDQGLEEVIRKRHAKDEAWKNIPTSQTTLTNYFSSQRQESREAALGTGHPKIYITDVKTRTASSLPNTVAMRPTRMQLMLYRQLLGQLVDNDVEAARIFDRYKVDPSSPFSDLLIQQLSALDENVSPKATQDSSNIVESDDEVVAELQAYNNLEKLWMLMIQEAQEVFPHGSQSIGEVLNVEYRKSHTGELIGNKSFLNDSEEIRNFIAQELQMWRGERAPRGVDIEEAFKCRICEFADDCGWRKNKIEEHMTKMRAKQQQTS